MQSRRQLADIIPEDILVEFFGPEPCPILEAYQDQVDTLVTAQETCGVQQLLKDLVIRSESNPTVQAQFLQPEPERQLDRFGGKGRRYGHVQNRGGWNFSLDTLGLLLLHANRSVTEILPWLERIGH